MVDNDRTNIQTHEFAPCLSPVLVPDAPATELHPPPAAAPLTVIRFRDFLFPQRLLVETRAEENPLTLHNRRRMARPWPRVMRFVWEATLLLAITVFLIVDIAHKTEEVLDYSLFAFAWLLLRYHLFVNDQSSHLKSMTPGQLEHLVLTNLNRDDYFLHQFLSFCLRYWVAVACVAVGSILTAYKIVTLDHEWVWWKTYRSFFILLSLILLTWAVGAIQYVLEWRLFVGGNRTRYYLLVTHPLSLALAGLCCATVVVIGALRPAWWIAAFGIGLFLLFARIALALGRSTHSEADDWILAAFASPDSDWKWLPRDRRTRMITVMRDLVLPWQWGKARSEALASTIPTIPATRAADLPTSKNQATPAIPAADWSTVRGCTWDTFLTAFVHTILFACLYATGAAVLLSLIISALHGRGITFNPQVTQVAHFIGGASALPAMFAALWVFHIVRKATQDGNRKATAPLVVGLYGRWLWLAALMSSLLGGVASLVVYLSANWDLSVLGYYPLSTLLFQVFFIAGLAFFHNLGLCVAMLAGCMWALGLARRAGKPLPTALVNTGATLVAASLALAFYLAQTFALQGTIKFVCGLRGWLADLRLFLGLPLHALFDLIFVFVALLLLRHATGFLARADRRHPPAPAP